MGIFTYDILGSRTLSTCPNVEQNPEDCQADTVSFVFLFVCILILFTVFDFLPIHASNPSTGTVSNHLCISVTECLLCSLVSVFVADIGFDLLRTPFRFGQLLAICVPFVFSLLSRIGPCLMRCLPKSERRGLHTVASSTSSSTVFQQTKNDRRKSKSSLPGIFGAQGAGRQRERHQQHLAAKIAQRGGSSASTVLEDVVGLDDKNAQRLSRWDSSNLDHKKEGHNNSCASCASPFACIRSLSYRLHHLTDVLFGGLTWDMYEAYSAMLSIVSVYIYVHGTYETSVYRVQSNAPRLLNFQPAW